MTRDRLLIPQGTGEAILKIIEAANDGREADIIIIAITRGKNPQPSFCTNLEPEIMETVLEQIGTQLPRVKQSRRMVLE